MSIMLELLAQNRLSGALRPSFRLLLSGFLGATPEAWLQPKVTEGREASYVRDKSNIRAIIYDIATY